MVTPAVPQLQNSGGVTFVKLPAGARLGVVLDRVGAAPDEGRPLRAADARRLAPNALAVVDGPMFSKCAGQPSNYATYTCGDAEYRMLDRNRGVDIASEHPSRGATLSVHPDGRAEMRGGSEVAPGAEFAVQLYPPLLRRGANVASPGLNRDTTWRVAVGILRDGSVAFALARMPMFEFAAALARVGFVEAGYTDGGGSAAIETATGRRAGSSENRRVPVWIAAFARDGAAPTLPAGEPVAPPAPVGPPEPETGDPNVPPAEPAPAPPGMSRAAKGGIAAVVLGILAGLAALFGGKSP